MLSGDEDAVGGKQRSLLAVPSHNDLAVLHIGPLGQCRLAAEFQHFAWSAASHFVGQCIVPVEDGNTTLCLMGENILFGLGVLLHGLMDIQMVGRKIGKHRNIRAGLERHKLERRQLQYRHVLWGHLPCFRQQRFANVAAQVDSIPSVFQHL